MSLLPHVCLLVNSVDRVGDFLIEVFGCEDQNEGQNEGDKPVLHRVIQLSQGSSIIIVQKDSCNDAALIAFNLFAVKHLFISVNDIEKVRLLSVKLGAQVSKNEMTERITVSFFDGTEEITIHAMDIEKNKQQSPHDLIMNAMLSHGSPDIVLTGMCSLDNYSLCNYSLYNNTFRDSADMWLLSLLT
jgi:hypothetical protein